MAQRKHRAYENDYPSVTTVLGVLRNIPLEWWFKSNTLEYINRESGKGRTIGTDIHKSLENYILTGQATVDTQYPDEVTTALHSFIKFRKERMDIELTWSEQALTHPRYFYNGTIDCIGKIDGNIIVLDWKSSKCSDKDKPDIYDSYKTQVAAYVSLYNYNQVTKEDAGTNWCMAENNRKIVEKAIIVSIAKDKVAYNLYEMNLEEIKDCFNEVFLPALKIWNFQHKKGE